MKYIYLFAFMILISFAPIIASAQTDTTGAKKDATKVDSAAAVKTGVDTALTSTPMNCYKQWMDAFTQLGTKPVTDGMQEVVVAFKSKESCHCYMGRVEISGGKIKAPLYVQTQAGDYKTFTELGRKLDPDFVSAAGAGLWDIANGMSVLFHTADGDYGRIFFYKLLDKSKQLNKEAPSPADLLKN